MTVDKSFRVMQTGASRDIDTGKLQYSKYINPINDYSFAKYMLSKQFIGGEWREGDNRQKGLGEDSLFESLCRHIEIVKLLTAGYEVVEFKHNGVVGLYVLDSVEELQDRLEEISEDTAFTDIQPKDIVSELNAVRFNSEALKLYKLGFYK